MTSEWLAWEGESLRELVRWLDQRGAEGYALASHQAVVRQSYRKPDEPGRMVKGECVWRTVLVSRAVRPQGTPGETPGGGRP